MKIVQFHAMWCSACLIMKSRFGKIKDSISKDIEVLEYDYEMDDTEVQKWQIGNVLPVYIFLNEEGKEVKRICGEWTESELLQEIEQLIEVVKNEKM